MLLINLGTIRSSFFPFFLCRDARTKTVKEREFEKLLRTLRGSEVPALSPTIQRLDFEKHGYLWTLHLKGKLKYDMLQQNAKI